MIANSSASADLPRQTAAEVTSGTISAHPPHAHQSSSSTTERNRSFAHLTSVSATLAIRELDAALLSPTRSSRAVGGVPGNARSRDAGDGSSTSSSGLGVSQGSDGTATQIMRVSDVADPTRVAAERAVLQERFDRRQRVHPRVFQQLTTKRTPSAHKLSVGGSKRARLDPSATPSGSLNEKRSASSKSDEEVYAPFSLPLLLRRLATFTLGNYSLYKKVKLPDSLDDGSPSGSAQVRQRKAEWRRWVENELNPVRCARLGWYVLSPSNNAGERPKGKERLRCGACKHVWSVEEWLAQEAASAYQSHVKEQEEAAKTGFATATPTGGARREAEGALKKMHREWCPWKVKYCEREWRVSLFFHPSYAVR
jgi:C3HC zinc finger-like